MTTGVLLRAASSRPQPSRLCRQTPIRRRADEPGTRRLLVEAAWHHRKAYRPGITMQARWEQAPPAAQARGHEANHWCITAGRVFTAHQGGQDQAPHTPVR